MRLTFRYRAYPTNSQVAFLTGELNEAASLYNAAVEERIGAWKTCRKSLNYYDQSRQLKAMRLDGCLSMANFTCCQHVLLRVDRTFRAFFERVRRGSRPGFPRYRSFRRYDSLTFKYGNGCKLLDNGRLRIQGAGHVKIRLHRPVEGRIKTLTVKREAGRWFVCFSVECDREMLPGTNSEIGIDVGLANFAVLSDGSKIQNPRYYRSAEARLRRCQHKVARRKNKRSSRRRKAVVLLARANAHVASQRSDFLHKESRKIVNRYALIAVEDLDISKLASSRFGKSICDAGWGSFIFMLGYKAECAGRRVVKVDARGTSQTCLCGERVPKTISDRWHNCPACGLSADRDHVSAQLILSRAGSPPSGANVEEVVSCVS